MKELAPDRLEKLEQLAQSNDIAKTRQKQILDEVDDEILKEYSEQKEKTKKAYSSVKVLVEVLAAIFISVVSSFFVLQRVYYCDQMELNKDLSSIKTKVDSFDKDLDHINEIRREDKSSMYLRLDNVENSIKTINKELNNIWNEINEKRP